MSGYAASARIVQATPRVAHSTNDHEELPPVAISATVIETDRSAAGDGLAARIAGSWTAFRERWTQLTFYLFDPQSWR